MCVPEASTWPCRIPFAFRACVTRRHEPGPSCACGGAHTRQPHSGAPRAGVRVPRRRRVRVGVRRGCPARPERSRHRCRDYRSSRGHRHGDHACLCRRCCRWVRPMFASESSPPTTVGGGTHTHARRGALALCVVHAVCLRSCPTPGEVPPVGWTGLLPTSLDAVPGSEARVWRPSNSSTGAVRARRTVCFGVGGAIPHTLPPAPSSPVTRSLTSPAHWCCRSYPRVLAPCPLRRPRGPSGARCPLPPPWWWEGWLAHRP